MKKKIVIAGGTGFLGKALESYFTDQGHTVVILTRKPQHLHHQEWDGQNVGPWVEQLEGSDILINLCGQSVDCRYTPQNKKAILDSRLIPTRLLNKAMSLCSSPPAIFINASSSTIYIHSEEVPMTERDGVIGCDFSMSVVKQWEAAFFEKELPGIRKVALRTSIVLGETGGAYPKLKQIIQLGLGGHQGNGDQMLSWISLLDYCRAVQHIIDTPYLEGALNITGPQPVTNKVFMRKLRKSLKPLFALPQPKWLLELGAAVIGTETELLLKSRYVIPERLQNSGFEFDHTTITKWLSKKPLAMGLAAQNKRTTYSQ